MKGFLTPWFAAAVAGAATVCVSADTPVIRDRDVSAAGRRIHFLEAGSGSPVVLLHGLGADVRTWRHAIPALTGDFHVYAIDQLGFGRSDKPEIPYRVRTLVDSLTAFLDAVGLEKVSLVGNSLGGWVAAAFAIDHPDRLRSLVLVDAAGYGEEPGQVVRDYLSQFDPATVALAEQMLRGMTPEQQRTAQALVASYVARRLSRPDGFAMASLAESMVRGEDALGPELKRIAAPTLVVWGRNDPIVPLRVGEALARDIPGARRVVLDLCGHRPQTECTAAFNAALRSFLQSF